MDPDLIAALDDASAKERRSRSAVIRRACKEYLKRVRDAELERQYVEGYRRIPDDPSSGDWQAQATSEVLPQEDW